MCKLIMFHYFCVSIVSAISVVCLAYASGGETDLARTTGCDAETPDCKNKVNELESCEWNEFQCENGECISMSRLCDSHFDCKDKSDESEHYCQGRTCNPYQFKCASGKCVPYHFVCNGEKDCLDGSDEAIEFHDSLVLPNVTIIPESTVLFGNDTFWHMEYEELVRVKFVCEASYPIEWVFNFENVAGSAEFKGGNILETLDPIETTEGRLPMYRNQLSISYDRIFDEDLFYCRAISHQCTQTMVLSKHEDESSLVEFRVSERPEKRITSIFAPTFGDDKSDCDAILYYEEVDENRMWRCAQPNGKPGKVVIIKCGHVNACNNYFRNNRQPKDCVKKDSVTCANCHKMSDTSRKGRVIVCYHEDESLRTFQVQVFNGLALGENITSKMYLDIADARPDELLYIRKFYGDTYIGEDIIIQCRASAYLFRPIAKIGMEYRNGSIEFIEPGEEFKEFKEHEYEHVTNITLQATTKTLTRIYCIGSSLRTLRLTNISSSIIIQVPIEPMLLVKLEDDQSIPWENETIQWDYGDSKKSIACNVSGKPVPQIYWAKDGSRIDSTFQRRTIFWAFSEIHFETVNETVGGVYNCVAANIVKVHSKQFDITVIGNSKTASIVGGVLASGVISAMIVIGGIKLARQREKKQKGSRGQSIML